MHYLINRQFRVRPKGYWEEWLKQARLSQPYEGNRYEHAAKMRARNAVAVSCLTPENYFEPNFENR
jgi:hypothetical protein